MDKSIEIAKSGNLDVQFICALNAIDEFKHELKMTRGASVYDCFY